MSINGSLLTYITYYNTSYEKKSIYDKYYRTEIYNQVNSIKLKEIEKSNEKDKNQTKLIEDIRSIKGLPSMIKLGKDYVNYYLNKDEVDRTIVNERYMIFIENMSNVTQLTCVFINIFLAYTINKIVNELKGKPNFRLFKKRIFGYILIGLPINVINIYFTSFMKKDNKDVIKNYELIGKKYRKLLE